MSGTEVKSYSSIDPEVLKRAKKEIGEDEERIDATLKIIREWLKKQPHLSCPPGKIVYQGSSLGNLYNKKIIYHR